MIHRRANFRRRWLTAVAVALVLCCVTAPGAVGQPATMGQWQNGPVFSVAPGPVHVHLLPSGEVMFWGLGDNAYSWQPSTDTIRTLATAGFEVFCSGHTFLPDGRLFVSGGHIANNVGLASAAIFDSSSNSWSRQPLMNAGRWYPTNTVLPNGDVLVISGSADNAVNTLPQVWQAATGTWRSLTSAQLELPLYPYMFLAPNGKVFVAGPNPITRYLDTSGTGAWSFVANRVGPQRNYGSAVMYDRGKILVAGGSDSTGVPPHNSAEVIDLTTPTPSWRTTAPMAFHRRHMNATMLPDGQVLVTGGTSGTGFNNATTPVKAAEMWNPTSETWSTLASEQQPRLYHSAALLLPDARVLATGGDDVTQTELFSPPYLFAGPRPTISSAPTVVVRAQPFFVGTPAPASITHVTWVRLPSVTHTFNMSQGFARTTTFARVTGGVDVTPPSSATEAPAGHYMLFLLSNGVPSVARIVRLADTGAGPVIASLQPSTTTAGGGSFTLTVNGTNLVAGSTVRWNGSARPTQSVTATQLTATIAASDIMQPGTASVTVATPAGLVSTGKTFTVAAPTTTQSVISFTLINADTDQPIAALDPLTNGATLNLSTLPTRNLSVRANTSPPLVGSVRFGLDGNTNFSTDTTAPYALAGDTNGNYAAWTPALGSHTLQATPYTGASGSGTPGTPLTVGFTVIETGPVNAPPVVNAGPDLTVALPATATLNATVTDDGLPNPPASVTTAWSKVSGPGTVTFGNAAAVDTTAGFSVAGTYILRLTANDGALVAADDVTVTVTGSQQTIVSFTLINADTDQPIAAFNPLINGAVLDLATLPTRNLNIRANTQPTTVGSVRFALDANPNFSTDKKGPYALAGDSNGNYLPWTPGPGSHTLTATPYTHSNARGTAGTSLTITFTVR